MVQQLQCVFTNTDSGRMGVSSSAIQESFELLSSVREPPICHACHRPTCHARILKTGGEQIGRDGKPLRQATSSMVGFKLQLASLFAASHRHWVVVHGSSKVLRSVFRAQLEEFYKGKHRRDLPSATRICSRNARTPIWLAYTVS